MREYSLACAVLFAAAQVTPSEAGSRDKTPQIAVEYTGLELASSEGAKAVLIRLEDAARHVCGYESLDLKASDTWRLYRLCYTNALDGAVAQVSSLQLAEAYGKPALIAAAQGDALARAETAKTKVVLSNR